jgi:hypothetical protein
MPPAGTPATAATVAQPFYTSKTFWTMALGAVFNLLSYFKVIPSSTDASTFVNSALLILGLIFRWTADQPLSTSSSAVNLPKVAGVALLIGCALMGLSVSSCSANAVFVAPAACPGALNQFDCDTYQALVVAQAGINAAVQQFGSDAGAKTLINKAIASYNLAEDSYKAWHAAAAAGGVPDAATLTGLMEALAADLANLKAAFKTSARLEQPPGLVTLEEPASWRSWQLAVGP